jgi:response regulator RpfG family c-di-GMP phosphodiesterase
MDTLTIPANPISVLVVDEEPSILVFLARVLDANGMRALLARNGSEAVGIAERNYISIDLILINGAVLELHEPELLDRLHRIRPGVRDLRMAACVDHGVIRVQLIVGGAGMKTAVCDDGLLESIRKSASTPLVRRAGRLN